MANGTATNAGFLGTAEENSGYSTKLKLRDGEIGFPSIGDENGNTVLAGFHIETISVDNKADLISAPIELGEKRFDNKVLQPRTINVTGYVQQEEYNETLLEMEEMYENRTYKFYQVLTRSGFLYDNMCLQNNPLKETPEKYDLIYCTLTFQQMIITKKMSKYAPQSKSDSSTKNTGTKGVK